MLAGKKKSSPLKSNHPENFSLLCTQKRNQGRVLTNTRYICRSPSASLLFYPKGCQGTTGWSRCPAAGSQRACSSPTQEPSGRGSREGGRGARSPPRLPVVRTQRTRPILLPERLQHTRHMCIPKDRRSRTTRWGMLFCFFFTFFILVPKINTCSESQPNSPTDTSTAWKRQFSF